MNTSAKGWRKEKECRRLLESQGWVCVFKSIRWRWGTLDFAKLFDSVFVRSGIKNQEPFKEWLFVSNKHFQGYHLPHQQAIKDFKAEYGTEDQAYQLWIWHRPKWSGRGSNKVWESARWQIISL